MASDLAEPPSVPCVVCRDRAPVAQSRFDKEQNGAVCADCVTGLRWAQAHLKTASIVGCTQEPDSYSKNA